MPLALLAGLPFVFALGWRKKPQVQIEHMEQSRQAAANLPDHTTEVVSYMLCARTKILYTNPPPEVSIGLKAVDWQRELYETKASELILYGRALGLSHSEAEDVLQETFMALLKMEETPDNPVHYAVRGFRNRALNFKRGFLRRITRELESSRWFDRDSAESPHERAAMQCLQTLPAEQREVIVLKIWHEHTFEEIAELTQLSPNTVAGRYRYGMEKLRKCLVDGRKLRAEEEEREGGDLPDRFQLSPLDPRLSA